LTGRNVHNTIITYLFRANFVKVDIALRAISAILSKILL